LKELEVNEVNIFVLFIIIFAIFSFVLGALISFNVLIDMMTPGMSKESESDPI